MRLALALCVLFAVALTTTSATKIRFRSQDLHAVAERRVPIASTSVGSLSPAEMAAEPGMEGMNAEEWPADSMDASVIPNSNEAEIFSRHRFAPAPDAPAPTNYQADVKPAAPSTPAPTTPAPAAPATPAPAVPTPAPAPATPPASTPKPPSPYQGPVPPAPSPYQGPVPPAPSPYQGPVPPAPSPYQGPVKPSGYQGPPPPPAYQGPPAKGGRFGLGGNVSEQIVAQGVDYSALPADYQAALRTGNLVVLTGKPGPKGPSGDIGLAGPVNETTMKELKSLHDKLVVHLAERRELSRMESMVYPVWIKSKYVCPDGWVPLGYVESEMRFQCRPPGDGRTPGNEACNEIASFPKIYDRCGWSMHCRAPWTRYGCYTPPNIAGTPSEVKATIIASKAAEAGVPTVVVTSPVVPAAPPAPAAPNAEFNPIVKPVALNPNLTAAQVLSGTLSLEKTQFETKPVPLPTNPDSNAPKGVNIPNAAGEKQRGPFASPYPVNVSVQHSLQPADLKNATNLLDEILESMGKARVAPVDFNSVAPVTQREKNSTELIDQTIYSFKQKHDTEEDDMSLDRYAIQLNE